MKNFHNIANHAYPFINLIDKKLHREDLTDI